MFSRSSQDTEYLPHSHRGGITFHCVEPSVFSRSFADGHGSMLLFGRCESASMACMDLNLSPTCQFSGVHLRPGIAEPREIPRWTFCGTTGVSCPCLHQECRRVFVLSFDYRHSVVCAKSLACLFHAFVCSAQQWLQKAPIYLCVCVGAAAW